MNIAVTGPEMYAFQDLVCVELALGWQNSGLQSMIPEPVNGEDSTLFWPVGTPIQILEVQVKGASKDLTLTELATFLAHYPSRKAAGSLLDRLIADPSRGVLFVGSGRIADAITILRISAGKAAPPTPRAVPRVVAQALAQEWAVLAAPQNGDSALTTKRRADIMRLAALGVDTSLGERL